MSERLTAGSLFTGYGGLDQAVESFFDARTVWVSDFEEGPKRVIESRFPGIPNLGDITKVDWSTVAPVDIITGGSPCQDVSTAGRRAGMHDGTRSNLWASMREGIAQLRPRYVVWENVRGALSASAYSDMGWAEGLVDDRPEDRVPKKEKDHPLRALGRVLGDLADLGFDAEWVTVPASAVGAPHRRERVFVLAWDREADTHPLRAGDRSGAAPPVAPRATPERLRLLPTPRVSSGNGVSAREVAEGNPKTRLETAVALLPTSGGEKFGEYAPAISRWAGVLGREAPEPVELSARGKPQSSARFGEWMMGIPDGWVTSPDLQLSRREQWRLIGNGVVPQQAHHALGLMATEPIHLKENE